MSDYESLITGEKIYKITDIESTEGQQTDIDCEKCNISKESGESKSCIKCRLKLCLNIDRNDIKYKKCSICNKNVALKEFGESNSCIKCRLKLRLNIEKNKKIEEIYSSKQYCSSCQLAKNTSDFFNLKNMKMMKTCNVCRDIDRRKTEKIIDDKSVTYCTSCQLMKKNEEFLNEKNMKIMKTCGVCREIDRKRREKKQSNK